jgi:hypothetical protein
MSTRTRTSSDPLLAAVRASRDEDARLQVVTLTAVLDWAAAHPASESDIVELLDVTEEPALHLAVPGAPMVGAYAALDLAHSLGMTTDAGLAYLGKALELRHRLPRLYNRVVRLEVPVWKAFRVAEQTTSLPVGGAAFVDAKIAPFLHTCSLQGLDLGRGVTIYAHLDASDVGLLGNTQTPVLVQQVKDWCQAAGTKVTVKPVIDLASNPSTEAYRPSDAIREHVVLRDRTCVFPDCRRRKVDLDHIVPFDAGGTTSADNLAMLCRRHHRAKTHSTWRYWSPEPGVYHWTSPTGATTTVDRRRRP